MGFITSRGKEKFMDNETVVVEIGEDFVAEITLNRPNGSILSTHLLPPSWMKHSRPLTLIGKCG
jgi:hypothetical protein